MDPTSSTGRLTRRVFCRVFSQGLAAGLSVPAAFSLSRLALAAPSERPRRLIVVYIPHGFPAEHWDPKGQGTDFGLTEGTGHGILAPLEPWKDRLVIFRGARYRDYGAHPAIKTALTAEGDRSVDQEVAAAWGIRPLRLGVLPLMNGRGEARLFREGEWVVPYWDPARAAAERLEGPPLSGGVDPESALRSATAELTRQRIEALRRRLAGLTREQDRLKAHLDAVDTVTAAERPRACGGAHDTPTLDAIRAAGPAEGWFRMAARLPDILDAHLEVAAAAARCGSARVIGLQILHGSAQVNFGFMGISYDHHSPMSHWTDKDGRLLFATAQRWIVQRIADQLISRLDTPDPLDPAHTVLDNTLVYFCSEVGDGARHNTGTATIDLDNITLTSHLPLFTLGGAGGGLTTGRIVDVAGRPHADLLLTLCHAVGVPTLSFGPDSTGPLAGVLT